LYHDLHHIQIVSGIDLTVYEIEAMREGDIRGREREREREIERERG
jgi:hypothetical protein